MNERQSSPTPPLVASTTETAKPSNQELAATIETWRERRHWTPNQWREVVGKENWPLAEANLNRAHNKAVDALVARLEALLAERDALEEQLALVARTLEPIAYPGKKLLGGLCSAESRDGGGS